MNVAMGIFRLSLTLILAVSVGYGGNKKFNASGKDKISISLPTLREKIKGGWAGKTIGVTYGGPTEFRYQGTMIQDYQTIPWTDSTLVTTFVNDPGLYDDIYMNLTFVDVIERCGLDAPADSFAMAFAHAGYPLWHANQAARYNILHGIMPPRSGYWVNNPHADCIDFQIESDFAGLMSPCMPNTAGKICDKIGHIMNYGDGWYGGVYVATMYTLAFTSNSVGDVVAGALAMIPQQSDFYKCINDMITGYKNHPDDWKMAWFEAQRTWSEDVGCPEGVFSPFDIDAKINAAYVVIGLLYGKGDFGKTIDIAARCGQDSDCNPATAGGILGTILGYNQIPELWRRGIPAMENKKFPYTALSLDDVYDIGYNHALKNIRAHGGEIANDHVTIALERCLPVRYERGFEHLVPVERVANDGGYSLKSHSEYELTFDGTGFVMTGSVRGDERAGKGYVAEAELYVDGAFTERAELPLMHQQRRYDLFWKYGLPRRGHVVRMRWLNPVEGVDLIVGDVIVYSDEPSRGIVR